MGKVALVLSGGGARGAYQLGVWKALKKLNIKYDIVTGTSVGALNAVMMVQKEFYKCLWLWHNISFDTIYEKHEFGNLDVDKEIIKIYKNYLKNFIKDGGMNVGELEELLRNSYKEKKFYKSNIDFGLVTYNVSKLEPVCLTKKQIPPYLLPDYVIASATCYPAFQPKKINDSLYIDGGIYDIMPINLAIDMGATEVIAVDLKSFGIKKPIKNKEIPITYISPRNKIVPFLVFDKIKSQQTIRFGYNDTMKTFKKLDGNKFTFKKDHLNLNCNKYKQSFVEKLKKIIDLEDKKIFSKLLEIKTINKIIEQKNINKTLNDTIEYIGEIFELPQYSIYSIKKYNTLILKKIEEVENINKKEFENNIKNGNIKDIINSKTIIKHIYNEISICHTKKQKSNLCMLANLFNREFLAALYLSTIKEDI